MSKTETPKTAFPYSGVCDDLNYSKGMTLRDYFAAKAMTMKFGATGTSIDLSHHAKHCYEMADAMLLERAK